MKWVIFAVALGAIIPAARWLRAHPRVITQVWILFGFLPFGLNLHISPIDWPQWRGYVFGLQVTVLDLLALIIFFTLPRARYSIPFRLVMASYFVAVALSVFQARVPEATVFYAWQLARVFFVYAIVARASSDERIPTAILTGMAIGLCYQAIFAIWQRFGAGILQTGGSLGDKNLLGLVSEFALFPIFALLLAGKRGWLMIVASLSGIIVAVLTTSRAAVGLAAAGLLLLFVLSSIRRWTTRKASVLFIGLVVIISLSPIALSSFEKRFATDPNALTYDERTLFENAAALILSDHPFGAGANNYVIEANSGGYLERAKVPWGGGQRDSIVHNAYWLAAAETGYLGAATFALLLLSVMVTAFRCCWRNGNDLRGDVLLGLGVSVLIVSIHNNYEWVFFLYDVQYLFAITAGLVAGLSTQLGYWNDANQSARQLRPKPLVTTPPLGKVNSVLFSGLE